jgi:tetratricopeptide (TPR) repeat protein
VKYPSLYTVFALCCLIILAPKLSAELSNVPGSVKEVETLLNSGHHLAGRESLMPQLKAIYSGITNTPEKLQILRQVAEVAIHGNGNGDEDRYSLLEFAVAQYALFQNSEKDGVWPIDILRKFLKSEPKDLCKAEALTNLIRAQVIARDQNAAKKSLEQLRNLTRSSKDLQMSKDNVLILTAAIDDFSEGIESKEDKSIWLESLQRWMNDPQNSTEEKCVYTMALGDAYSDEGTMDKARAAKALFYQSKKVTGNVEQKLECLHMISYCCYRLSDYTGSIAAIREMMSILESLSDDNQSTAGRTVAQAVWSAEEAFRREQEWRNLVEIRGMLIKQYGKYLPSGEVFYFSVENGRDSKASGDIKDAITWYDAAIKLYPTFGWENGYCEELKGVGWNESAIVNLNYEKVDSLDPTNHLERIKMLEPIWAKYGSNEWALTFNLGANLANEYFAVGDGRGKEFLSHLTDRMDLASPKAGPSDAKLIDNLEGNCLIKLALWYGQDKETEKMRTASKKYLSKYPNGNNAFTAKSLLASATRGIVPPKEETATRRIIILAVLALLTVVPLIVIIRGKTSSPNKIL